MAVSITNRPFVYPLNLVDKRLPISMYLHRSTLAGDVSGGLSSITIQPGVFQNALWSVEQCAQGHTTAGAARTYSYDLACQQTSGSNIQFRWRKIELGIYFATQDRSYSTLSDFLKMIFYPDVGTAWSFLFATDNINLATHEAYIWGFMWDVSASRLPGGPLKPTNIILPFEFAQ